MKTNEEYYSLRVCSHCGNPLTIKDYPSGRIVMCSECDFYHWVDRELLDGNVVE